MNIGYAVVDITPPIGVELSGYGYFLNRRSERIMDHLYARAILFEEGKNTLLLINCDLIGLYRWIVDRVKNQLSCELGIDRKCIMLSSTHTHTGPATGKYYGCGEPDQDYLETLVDALVDSGRSTIKNIRKVSELKYLQVPIEPIGFNRVYADGPIDNNVRCMTFYFERGRPLVVANYGCHPVTLGRSTSISADYPGRVVEMLDRNGYDGLFLNGFCGDVDPISNLEGWGSGHLSTIEEYGERISNGFLQNVYRATSIDGISIDAFEFSIQLDLQYYDREGIERELESYIEYDENPDMYDLVKTWADNMKDYLDTAHNPYVEEVEIQIFKIGSILLVGFPGEVFTELGTMISKGLPKWNIITMGNCNEPIGYIPTETDIVNRGYAGFSSCFLYDRLPFKAGEGEKLAQQVVITSNKIISNEGGI